MGTSKAGYDLIKEFEGCYLNAYLDPVGIWTIGWGTITLNNRPVRKGDSITQKLADELLQAEVEGFEKDVNSIVEVPVTQSQYDALVSFAYNLGAGNLVKIAKLLNAGDVQGAADKILQFDHGEINGELVKIAGLTRRRIAEREMFLSDIKPAPQKPLSEPTWFDVQRSISNYVVVTGYAGEKPVAQITTRSSLSLAKWLLDYADRDILVAPPEKPIPRIDVPKQKSINQKLLEYCTDKDNYFNVANEVLKFYPDGTSNGCAAYCSQFLRDIGVPVPIKLNADGWNISLIAQSLAEWLLENGWQKIAVKNIMPGDVCVTNDDPQYPGFAAHIFIVTTPVDNTGFALAVDNNSLNYKRNITALGPKTPTRYALRAL